MKDPLLSLAPSELRALATSVRNGRVSAPYSALSLQRIIGQDAAGSISGKLASLSASGMSSEALSVCLELTADALSSRSPLEDSVDLVTTGPEVGGVANRTTAVVVTIALPVPTIFVATVAFVAAEFGVPILTEKWRIPHKANDLFKQSTRLNPPEWANRVATGEALTALTVNQHQAHGLVDQLPMPA